MENKIDRDFARHISADDFSVEAAQASLQIDELCLDYFISEFGCGVFLIDREHVEYRRIEITSDSLYTLVSLSLSEIFGRDSIEEAHDSPSETIKILSKILIPWDAMATRSVSTIRIIPADNLHLLPFAVLSDSSGAYLIEHYDAAYSLALWAHYYNSLRPAPISTCSTAVLIAGSKFENLEVEGVPNLFSSNNQLGPLSFAEDEVKSISALLDQEAKTLKCREVIDAPVDSLSLKTACFLHAATHGLAQQSAPEYSALAIDYPAAGEIDGLWLARDIAREDLDLRFVFLSACQTAGGARFRGEGVVSLARPFIAAGARSVVATLWSVDDRSSVEFSKNFYKSLANGSNTAHSLAIAQRAMINSPREVYRNPYYWAPYIHIGVPQGL